MLKIVHELNQLDFGGVEKVIRNIIKFDEKNEHTIIAYKDGLYRKNLEEVGAKVILMPEGNDDIDLEADVIHIHSGGGISNLAQSIGLQFPVVETIHSPIRSPMPQGLIAQRVGVSNVVSKMNNKAITIYNGLDYDTLDVSRETSEIKEELGIREGIPVIGRLGRLGKDKGLEEWILACYYLQKRGYDFVPLIIGDEARDCEGYRGKLKLMCSSLPLKNVVWAGHREDIANYLLCMDIFLYPSLTEGFGLVIAEAMEMFVPVVTYDNPVNFELFGGYAAFAKQKDGIMGLVARCEMLLTNDVYREALIGMPAEFVREEYNAEKMSLEYQELYERCDLNFNGAVESQKEHSLSA